MKLLTKSSLYIATLSLFLFFIMGIIFFQVLKNLSLAALDRELLDLKEIVDARLMAEGEIRTGSVSGIDSLSVLSGGVAGTEEFGDTLMFDREYRQYRTYRDLTFVRDRGENVTVRIFKSTTPSDQLVERVTLMMAVMVILFMSGIFLLNRFVFASLWKDFFLALDKLKEFDPAGKPVILGEQDIDEFREMKTVLERMTRQLTSDYRELKEYTDHTTHELQTPLAVIKSKTELLLQSEHLGPGEMKLIQAVNTSANQLSRLNATLTLITRIENHQFTGVSEINLVSLLDRHLEMLRELIDLRGIRVERDYGTPEASIYMDEGLADILVANLLKNAIVHNVDGGTLVLETGNRRLVISNEGPGDALDGKKIFRRFEKGRISEGGFGLGLSLVRKICETYDISIGYAFSDRRHIFTLDF